MVVNSNSRRRRSITPENFITVFSPSAFQSAISATIGSPSINAAEVDVLALQYSAALDTVEVEFGVAVSSESVSLVTNILAQAAADPSQLLRNLALALGPILQNVSLGTTSVRSLRYAGIVYTNPLGNAIFQQLAQLYQLYDAIDRTSYPNSSGAALLETTLTQLEARLGVGAIGATGKEGARGEDLFCERGGEKKKRTRFNNKHKNKWKKVS